MNLSNLFANNETSTKIASVAPSAPASGNAAATARNAVDAALQAATVKTAGVAQPPAAPAGSPTGDLDKVAAEIIEQNHQRRLKHAFEEGRAHCDGFMSQLAVYEKVAADKAGAAPTEAEKIAADKAAQATEERVINQVHKVASDHYLGGYEAARAVLS